MMRRSYRVISVKSVVKGYQKKKKNSRNERKAKKKGICVNTARGKGVFPSVRTPGLGDGRADVVMAIEM